MSSSSSGKRTESPTILNILGLILQDFNQSIENAGVAFVKEANERN